MEGGKRQGGASRVLTPCHVVPWGVDTLISPSGKILIPGIREAVDPLTDEEWKTYQDIEFDIENYKNKLGVTELMYNNKVRQSSSSSSRVWGFV